MDIREKYASDYKRLRGQGLSDKEAIARIKRFEQQRQEALEYAEQLENNTLTGPRGGKYRINSNGRKSYDVP